MPGPSAVEAVARRPASTSAWRGTAPHGLRSGSVQAASARRPPRPQHAARLAQRGAGIEREHVAPAAQDGVDVAVGRSIHSSSSSRNSTFVTPQLGGTRSARASSIASAPSLETSVPPGCDQLGREEARLAEPGRQLEHALARLRLDRVDEPARDGHRGRLEALVARGQPAARALPAVARRRRAARRDRSIRHRRARLTSSRRSSLPDGGARERRRERDLLRHLEARRAARRTCARSSSASACAAVVQDDGRDDRLPPLRVGPPVDAARRRRPGCASSTASTSAGATFSPPVTIVSALRPVTRQAAVARRGRRGRRCAAAVVAARRPGATVGPPTRISPAGASSTRVPEQRDARGLGLARREVATCEQASVRPYVCATGTPASAPCARAARAASGPPPSSAARSAAARAGRRRAGAAERRRDERDERDRSRSIASSTASGSKRSCSTTGRAVDRAAQQDREAADVAERQRAEPALLAGRAPSATRRAERVPQPVAVRQLDRLGLRRSCRTCG